eukprot:TRINITY_DN6110_c0_g3_i2.p2 TRINITY_DN6110_c0_g3~~TRINITY_DN6110_c0_g3_i2.p2  ORF type:complete len:108 (+),score=42.17 TRINITY_DN6110_c0_g3_i2:243-566(+)
MAFLRMMELTLQNEQMRRETARLNNERRTLDRKARLMELHNKLLMCKKNYTVTYNCLLKVYAEVISLQTELLKDHYKITQGLELVKRHKKASEMKVDSPIAEIKANV